MEELEDLPEDEADLLLDEEVGLVAGPRVELTLEDLVDEVTLLELDELFGVSLLTLFFREPSFSWRLLRRDGPVLRHEQTASICDGVSSTVGGSLQGLHNEVNRDRRA